MTKPVTISRTLTAYQGSAYTDRFLGLTVQEPTWDGTPFVGVVTAVVGTAYAIITAPDGRWMRTATNVLHVTAPTAKD